MSLQSLPDLDRPLASMIQGGSGPRPEIVAHYKEESGLIDTQIELGARSSPFAALPPSTRLSGRLGTTEPSAWQLQPCLP